MTARLGVVARLAKVQRRHQVPCGITGGPRPVAVASRIDSAAATAANAAVTGLLVAVGTAAAACPVVVDTENVNHDPSAAIARTRSKRLVLARCAGATSTSTVRMAVAGPALVAIRGPRVSAHNTRLDGSPAAHSAATVAAPRATAATARAWQAFVTHPAGRASLTVRIVCAASSTAFRGLPQELGIASHTTHCAACIPTGATHANDDVVASRLQSHPRQVHHSAATAATGVPPAAAAATADDQDVSSFSFPTNPVESPGLYEGHRDVGLSIGGRVAAKDAIATCMAALGDHEAYVTAPGESKRDLHTLCVRHAMAHREGEVGRVRKLQHLKTSVNGRCPWRHRAQQLDVPTEVDPRCCVRFQDPKCV